MRGPPPKPTHLKLILGNPGRKPLPKREPKPRIDPDVPTPPPELSDDAKTEWTRIAPELYRIGLLTKADRATFAGYCQACGNWLAALRALDRMRQSDVVFQGLLVKTANGMVVANPLIKIARLERADMLRFAAEFGMTPSARSRIEAQPPLDDDEEDAAKEFFG